MANIKISELPAAAAGSGTQEFEVNDGGTSRKVTGSQISSYVRDEVILSDLDITATASELNILDGATLSTTELNLLDGVTATTSELNLLDGVTWTLTDYNTLTATAAELNVLDGITGLASQAEAEAGTAADKLMTPERTGEAILALAPESGLGIDQSWSFVTGSRALNTTYTNTTGKPIMVFIRGNNVTNSLTYIYANINGTFFIIGSTDSSGLATPIGSVVVPKDATYNIQISGSAGLNGWLELR
jgi:hypothetical protein